MLQSWSRLQQLTLLRSVCTFQRVSVEMTPSGALHASTRAFLCLTVPTYPAPVPLLHRALPLCRHLQQKHTHACALSLLLSMQRHSWSNKCTCSPHSHVKPNSSTFPPSPFILAVCSHSSHNTPAASPAPIPYVVLANPYWCSVCVGGTDRGLLHLTGWASITTI